MMQIIKIQWQLRLLIMAISFAISYNTNARPVSYPGGSTMMLQDTDVYRSLHLHYTPKISHSYGYRYEQWKNKNISSHLLQRNDLLKRWNRRDSQANLYLKTAVGVTTLDDNDANYQPSGVIGVAGDWETRRYFTSFESRYTDPRVVDDFFRQTARIGIAPYLGDYGDLHTWIMFEVKHRPDLSKSINRTLIVRLFKGVQLFEIGINDTEELSLTYVLRL